MTTQKRRGKRTTTRPNVVLTDRDVQAFTLLARVRYASIENFVEAGLFTSLERARHRARSWLDSGWVEIHVLASNQSACVSLAPGGIAILRERDHDLTLGLRPPSALRKSTAAHHLAIVSTRLYALAIAARLGWTLLEWANAGSDLGRELGLRRLRLDPDGLGRFEDTSGTGAEFTIAVEVDLAQEDVPVTLTEKFGKLALPLATGLIAELWVVAAGGPERLQNVQAAIHRAGIAHTTRLLPLESVRTRPAMPLPPPLATARAGSGGEASLNSLHADSSNCQTPQAEFHARPTSDSRPASHADERADGRCARDQSAFDTDTGKSGT